MSEAPFKRGDIVETIENGGLGLIVGIFATDCHIVLVDWYIYPKGGGMWVFRDDHPEFDLQTDASHFRKVGEITL